MKRDVLFLLKHGFEDGPGAPWYCPECAEINGLLHYHPELRHHIDVRYVDFQRPRPEVIALLGEPNQSCPVLVLGDESPHNAPDAQISPTGHRRFIAGAHAIGTYLSSAYGTARPH
jgi:hypothetical protein